MRAGGRGPYNGAGSRGWINLIATVFKKLNEQHEIWTN